MTAGRRLRWRGLGVAAAAAAGYLTFWPVPIAPVAWTPSADPGFTGPFAANDRLVGAERVPLAGFSGPEDLAQGASSQVLATVRRPGALGGAVVSVDPLNGVRVLMETPSRPLGIDAAPGGEIYLALADRGLARLAPGARALTLEVVLDQVDGAPIRYPNDVALGPGGRVFLTDSTQRHAPADYGGTLAASIADIAEHQRTGRVIAFDPADSSAEVISEGYAFANGIALADDGSYLAVVETAAYRVWKLWLSGPKAGAREILIEGLPGFPDNIEADGSGGFWLGLVSPRRAIVDRLAAWPALRSALFRLPASLRPGPTRYGAVVRIDGRGRVIETLQDPAGGYARTTGALPVGAHLYVSSLTEPWLARLPLAGMSFAEARR